MNASNAPSSSSSHSDFSGGEDRPSYVGGFTYGVGVSLGILILITTITLASYFCTRDDGSSAQSSENQQQQQRQRQRQRRDNDQCVIAIEGIDEDTLKTYPKCLYSQLEKINKNGSTVSCCSICLADYKGKDVVRQLPECGHVFHLKCVDPWLRRHPTCPVCRTSPLPTPQSTPLVEVAPLAATATRIG